MIDQHSTIKNQLSSPYNSMEQWNSNSFKCCIKFYFSCNEMLHFLFRELTEEKKFLDLTTTEKKCVVHFYHTDFRRCAIMDTHLEVINNLNLLQYNTRCTENLNCLS